MSFKAESTTNGGKNSNIVTFGAHPKTKFSVNKLERAASMPKPAGTCVKPIFGVTPKPVFGIQSKPVFGEKSEGKGKRLRGSQPKKAHSRSKRVRKNGRKGDTDELNADHITQFQSPVAGVRESCVDD